MLLSFNVFAADVTLQWDANMEPDLAGYRFYQGVESGVYGEPTSIPLESLTDQLNPEFMVINLTPGTYYFVVDAYDTEGLCSGYSKEVESNLAPSNPTGLKVKVEIVVTVQ